MRTAASRIVKAMAPALLIVAGCASVQPSGTANPTSRGAGGAGGPRGPVSLGWQVTRVVDGDTVEVSRSGTTLTVRLIGINTPETVAPDTPTQCFGPQATAFADARLLGRRVSLERDPTQAAVDRYGRTLAYVWLQTPDGPRSFNLQALRQGVAVEYTYDEPYLWRPEFVTAERLARRHQRGLWAQNTCDGNIDQPATGAPR